MPRRFFGDQHLDVQVTFFRVVFFRLAWQWLLHRCVRVSRAMDRTWRQCNRESLNADSFHQDGKLVYRQCARYLWKTSNPAPQGSKNGYPFNSKFAKWIYTQTSDWCTFVSACRTVFDAFPIQIIHPCFRVINLQNIAQGLRLLWDSLCGPAGKSNGAEKIYHCIRIYWQKLTVTLATCSSSFTKK